MAHCVLNVIIDVEKDTLFAIVEIKSHSLNITSSNENLAQRTDKKVYRKIK